MSYPSLSRSQSLNRKPVSHNLRSTSARSATTTTRASNCDVGEPTRIDNKPRLLVLSHVLPFPRRAGQQQRVFYTVQAARELFHVTFAATVTDGQAAEVTTELSALCDEVVLLPSRYAQSEAGKAWHKTVGAVRALLTGLKLSNYIIGQVEFSPSRMTSLLEAKDFDCVLFEYWHAAGSVEAFRAKGIPCVLDMHDILWQARARQMKIKTRWPSWLKRRHITKYKAREEHAWKQFDGVIAINQAEKGYVKLTVPDTMPIFYAPMGTDLTLWPYSWEPSQTIRVGYYGGLSSPHNQQDAMTCFTDIMPHVWRRFPDAELWLVGSNPPESIRALAVDPRVKVTGYVEDVQQILRTMSVVACPWTGTYGFRSRLVEVMALGVPLVTTDDAVWGMGLEDGNGLLLGKDDDALAAQVLRLLDDTALASEQSRRARQQVEQLFSLDNTYGRLARELSDWLRMQKQNSL